MNKKYKPNDLPSLIPYLTVVDPEASIAFYEKAFGFKIKDAMKDKDENIEHVEMSKDDDIVIMFSREGAFGSTSKSPKTLKVESSINLYIYCRDVDSLYNKAIKGGAVEITKPEDKFWGDRFCQVEDIDGYTWSFATMLNNKG
jgi:PhnB protein